MPVLHNRISNEELKARMLAETEPRTTVSFYKYFSIAEPQMFRDDLYRRFEALKVFGRIYIAHEGINAQISVPQSHFGAFKEALGTAAPELQDIRLNIAVEDDGKSFWVLRMKVRKQIVADGIDDPTFNPAQVGRYLKADEVNQMIDDPDTVFVDMRNHYEYEVGHFQNAIEVPSDTFREQLPMALDMLKEQKDKNIVMYCTGGIRCEKASAYMLHNGFKNVFHVEGGIIEYARTAKAQELPMKFIGKNFVFDERLGERITNDVIAHCHQCGQPCDTHTNCKNDGCHLLFIQCSDCAGKYDGCCSEACVQEYHLPEEEQRTLRAGRENGIKIFNKSKDHPLRKHRSEWQQERVDQVKLDKLNLLTRVSFQAFLYDCDGTLADNMQAHKDSYVKAAAEYGFNLDPALIDELAGLPTTEVVTEISRRYNIALDPEAFAQRKGRIFFDEYIDQTRPISYVTEHLRQHAGKVKIGVVSGGRRATVEKTLAVLGLTDLIDTIVCAGETEKGKPFPDPFLKAAIELQADPALCMVFEDGDAGVQAAIAAGMQYIRIDKI